MANALPLILAAGAAAVLLGKKKKKTTSTDGAEPDFQPGSGSGSPEPSSGDFVLTAIPAQLADQDLKVALNSIPAKQQQPEKLGNEASEDVEKDKPKKAPPTCKVGDVSTDKKYVCWGLKGKTGLFEVKVRRVAKYKTARNAAAAVAMSGGVNVSPLMFNPNIAFAVWCWLNRNKKDIYRCTSHYKVGRGRCKPGKWKRY